MPPISKLWPRLLPVLYVPCIHTFMGRDKRILKGRSRLGLVLGLLGMDNKQRWIKVGLALLFFLLGHWQWHPLWIILLGLPVLFHFYLQYEPVENPRNVTDFLGSALRPHLPAWFLHPDVERVEWVNNLIKHVWPYVDKIVALELQKVVAKIRNKLETKHVKLIRFREITLGKIPPRINGIKFHSSTHRDEIIVDLDLDFAGDKFHFSLEAVLVDFRIPAIPISISNLRLAPVQIRLHIQPLRPFLPFADSVSVSLLTIPDFDFECGGLACILERPVLSDLFKHTLQLLLAQNLLLPNKVTLPLISEEKLKKQLAEHPKGQGNLHRLNNGSLTMPQGVLCFHLVEGKNLVKKNAGFLSKLDKSDPYATIQIKVDHQTQSWKTQVVDNDINPRWKMLIDLPVDDPESLEDVLLKVYDKDRGSSDDYLGSCVVPAQELRSAVHSHGQSLDIWKKILENEMSGSLHMEIGWAELKPEPDPAFVPSDSISRPHQGVISIFIDSCQGLPSLTKSGDQAPNPCVAVEVCNVSQWTDVVQESFDPVFEHRLNFLVTDPVSDRVEVIIKNEKPSGDALGRLQIRISDFLSNNELSKCGIYDLTDVPGRSSSSLVSQIQLSMAFRYIHRPPSRGFFSHLSGDLSKIYHHQEKPEESRQTTVPALEAVEAEAAIIPPSLAGNEEADEEKPVILADKPSLSIEPATATLGVGNSATWSRSSTLPSIRNDGVEGCKIQLSFKYHRKTATLSVVVHKLKQRPGDPSLGAFVKTCLLETIGPGRSFRVNNTKRKTTPQKNGNDPVFEETLTYLLAPHELKMRRLELTVYQTGRLLGRPQVLSRTIIGMGAIQAAVNQGEENPTVTDWYPLPTGSSSSNGWGISRSSSSSSFNNLSLPK